MAHCSGLAHFVRNVSPKGSASLLLLLAVTGASAAGSNDDYLQAIEVEADKVGVEEPATTASRNAGPQTPSSPMRAFERQLQDRFAGTYLFNKRLAPESKEEIYRQLKDGAPIEDVRRTIMNRFLHTR